MEMENPLSGHIVNDIAQLLAAVGVILTAVSSIMNSRKLTNAKAAAERAEEKAAHALDRTNVIVAKADEVKSQIEEVKEIIKNGH